MKKLIFISVLFFAFTAATFAQVSATATATAIIVGPIGITNTANMNFGNVAVSTVAGTVVLATDGSRSVTGGCTLPATTGSPAAATFTVTGAANYTYAITLPSTPTTLDDGAAHQMTVDNWQSDPSGTGDLEQVVHKHLESALP
jgi:hypothetical protein